MLVLRILILFCVPTSIVGYFIGNQYIQEQKGEIFEFKMTGFDPIDKIRGRYLDLNVVELSSKKFQNSEIQYLETSVEFKSDSNGFAAIDTIYVSKSPSNPIFARIQNSYVRDIFIQAESDSIINSKSENTDSEIVIEIPVHKFYMNEYTVKRVEEQILKALQDTTKIVSCKIQVYKGNMRIRDILINRKSIL